MFMTYLRAIGLGDVLDVAMLSVLIYAVLLWFKQARAAFIVRGMVVAAGVYLLARVSGMVMIITLFHAFFAILAVALVVIFQEELRRLFERIAVWSMSGGSVRLTQPADGDVVVRAAFNLASSRIGALIVLVGRDPLDRHLEGGWKLSGRLSDPLLKSIFDPNSIGHDGAVIMSGKEVTHFGCRLPLSRNFDATANVGTRHAAALGLAELTDALCIVVSEERGTVSVAHNSQLEVVADAKDLQARIVRFGAEVWPQQPRERFRMRRNLTQRLVAVSASLILWLVFVFGAKHVEHAFDVPIEIRDSPAALTVATVRPELVRVRVGARIGDFIWADTDRLSARLDLAAAIPGLNRVGLDPANISRPAAFRLIGYEPAVIEVELTAAPAPEQTSSTTPKRSTEGAN